MTDFVGLCRAARELPGSDTADRLWAAWCALPTWHFLGAPSPMGPLPFSHFIDGRRCVLAFTTPNGAAAYSHASQFGPPLALPPEAMMQRLPLLKSYGVYGFLVDLGPDGFHTSLDQLWVMFHRFRTPAPGPAPAPAAVVPQGPPPGSIEWWLALPAWHLAVSYADPMIPDFVQHGSELLARVYSSAQRAIGSGCRINVLPPAQVIAMITDVEIVKFLRLDDQVVVDVVDLALARKTRP